MKMFDVIHENPMPYPACTPILTDELTDKTDTAVYVLSRQAGEGRDRRVEKGDYLVKDLKEEKLNQQALPLFAGRILEMIFASDTCRGF